VEELALFFHILGAVLFIAGIVLAGTAFETARRRKQPAEVALLLSLTRIGVLLVAVGGLMVPIFGLWLVHLGGWGYGSGWVDAALALYQLRVRRNRARDPRADGLQVSAPASRGPSHRDGTAPPS
jgi:uncharacterized membrane protein